MTKRFCGFAFSFALTLTDSRGASMLAGDVSKKRLVINIGSCEKHGKYSEIYEKTQDVNEKIQY